MDANNHVNTDSTYAYDAAGNMTKDGSSLSYTFDDEGHLTIARGMTNGPYCYVYDGNGLRVAKKSNSNSTCSTGTVTKLYWRSIAGDAFAETDGSGSTTNAAYNEYVFFAGRRVASRNGTGGIFYWFADQLGSTRTITTGSGTGQTPGQLCYDADFTPYGQEISYTARLQTTACPPSYKFTGYERDPETTAGSTDTGLDYAFARYYSSRLGRFLSTDPLGGSIGDLQSHNAYAYTRNNPLNAIDPSGMNNCPDGKSTCGDDYSCPDCGAPGVDLFGGFGGCDVWDASCGLHNNCWYDFWGGDCAAANRSLDPSGRGQSELLASEAAWLASGSIPWYTTINGHLWLTSGSLTSGFIIGDPENGVVEGVNGFLADTYLMDLGPLTTTSSSSGNNSDSWWGTFGKTFVNGVLHGVRQPGQSFGSCVLQNADETTFGGHKAIIGTMLAGAASFFSLNSGLTTKMAVWTSISVRNAQSGFINLATVTAIAQGFSTASSFVIKAGKVAAAAEAGLLIGSAINCR